MSANQTKHRKTRKRKRTIKKAQNKKEEDIRHNGNRKSTIKSELNQDEIAIGAHDSENKEENGEPRVNEDTCDDNRQLRCNPPHLSENGEHGLLTLSLQR